MDLVYKSCRMTTSTLSTTHNSSMHSSDADIIVILESFNLEHCCHHSEFHVDDASALDFAALLPPPQKFVDGTANSKQRIGMERSSVVFIKRVACRSMGESIVAEEPARWTCESDERERAVNGAAFLIAAFAESR